tara:strand:+ start:1151 stop:1324 length:174 start_codon:yes stop_codon:yes gene_type:complete
MADAVVRLRNVRRNLTAVLLHLPVDTKHTSVAALLELLDYFDRHPEKYNELTREPIN